MRHLIVLLAATGCAAAQPPVATTLPSNPITAQKLVSRFAREFCVPGADRLKRIRAWGLPGWQAEKPRTMLGVTFDVDAPVPEHDEHSWGHVGPVKGGKARISSFTMDYKEKERIDYSSALLWIEPENLIDKAAIEKALGVQLIPNGKLMEWPGRLRITNPRGESITTKPRTRWAQHYNASSSFGEKVKIGAYRSWGEGEEEQTWRVQCGTYTPPIRH